MVVPFFQKALPCFLEVSLRNLGFFFLGPFLSLEVLFSDIRDLSKAFLVVFLGWLQLAIYVFLPASSKALKFTIYLQSLELLAVLLDSKFFLKASACVELLDNRSHRFINKNYCSYKSYEAVNDLYFTCKIYLFRKWSLE